jgi:uncharacterized protein YjbI with pentapeptide repeats
LDDIVVSLSQRQVLGLILLAVFLIVPIGISKFPHKGDPEKVPPLAAMQKQMGLDKLNGGAFFIAIVMWGLIFGSLLIGLFAIIWQLALSSQPDPAISKEIWDWRFSLAKLAALTATLGAVVAFPFTLVRLSLARQQTTFSEETLQLEKESLFDERLDKALSNMSASYIYKALGRNLSNKSTPIDHYFQWKDDAIPLPNSDVSNISNWTSFEESRPNIELRVAGFTQMEGIAKEYVSAGTRILSLLAGYIRQKAPAKHASQSPRRYYEEISQGAYNEYQVHENYGVYSDIGDTENMREWLSTLAARYDIEQCMQTVGRLGAFRKEKWAQHAFFDTLEGNKLSLNFSSTNLQAITLQGATIHSADFSQSSLEGSVLENCSFDFSRFDFAKLDGSRTSSLSFKNCEFEHSEIILAVWRKSNCHRANFQFAFIEETHLIECDFFASKLTNTKWINSNIENCSFKDCNLTSAAFSHSFFEECGFENCPAFSLIKFTRVGFYNVDLSHVDMTQEQLDQCFGDITVLTPPDLIRPKNWPDWPLGPTLAYHQYCNWKAQKNIADYVPPKGPVK